MRGRWVVPFSKQFAFIALSHAPLPRAWRCWLLDTWLRHLYWFCMIEHMAPPRASARRFTGQCSDAFFKLTHRVRLHALPKQRHLQNPSTLTEQCWCAAQCPLHEVQQHRQSAS